MISKNSIYFTRHHLLHAYTYALSGEKEKARKILSSLLDPEYNEQQLNYAYVAMVYVALGDNDKAFEWLEKAYEERSRETLWKKIQ